jgi:hypothetical protein
MDARKPALLRSLNGLYAQASRRSGDAVPNRSSEQRDVGIPWLNAPEDSWL